MGAECGMRDGALDSFEPLGSHATGGTVNAPTIPQPQPQQPARPGPTSSHGAPHPAAPHHAAPPHLTPQHVDPRATHQWLVRRRNDGATPDEICKELVASGWHADAAAQAALSSLRESDRHRWLYIALCWGAGLGALAAGTAGHLALAERSNPLDLAMAITVLLVAAPIAVVAGALARGVEEKEPHAIWSPSRRVLFGTLTAATATVGIFRALSYTYSMIAGALDAKGYDFTPASVVQVMVTLSIATPLFWWALTEWRRSNVALRSLTDG